MNGERSVTRLVIGALGIAASVAFLVSGCSEGALFPAVHDMPAPRADTPLTPDQVKQATDALTSERDRLNTANGQPGTTASVPVAAQQKPPSSTQPAATQTGATQTAGADTKP